MPDSPRLFARILALAVLAAPPAEAQRTARAQEKLEGNATSLPSAWRVGEAVFWSGKEGSFDEIAVKDPSIVQFEGRWHLFYTARGNGQYSLGYGSAEKLEDLNTAPHVHLEQLAGPSGYAAAPQVFFFKPQQRWYLIYQTREANYQPVYSVTQQIGQPQSWSVPSDLVQKEDPAKWIDFWVIADSSMAYLFYTRSHEDVFMRKTCLKDFPKGWGDGRKVFSGVHEAVNVYKVKGQEKYHMIYERRGKAGLRSFGLAMSKDLAGPWKLVDSTYATGQQLRYGPSQRVWTEEVSHGAALRSGVAQRMVYGGMEATWLIQGLKQSEHKGAYVNLPWRLGLIRSEK